MSSKLQRHDTILRLIRRERIGNQQQLRRRLAEAGIDVTQATLSRDLRDLGLAKVSDREGGGFYTHPGDRAAPYPAMEQLVPTLVLTVAGVGPLLVVRTPPGSAEALGGALDHAAWEGVLGTIAGDDTLLIIAESENARAAVETRLSQQAGLGG